MNRRKLAYERHQTTADSETPGTPASPLTSSSPIHRHGRSGSSYASMGNMKKAQTKAAAQRLAAVMAHQQSVEGDDDDDDDQLDYNNINGTGGIGLAGGRATRARSPMNKNMAQRRVPQAMTQQLADEDNDEDDILVTGTPSIGLGGGRAMQSRSPMHKNMPQRRAPVVMTQQPADEDGLLVSGTASIGLAGGRGMRSQSPANKNIAQRRAPQQPSDEDNDDDDLLVTGTSSIGLAGGRAMQSRSPATKNITQKRLPQVTTRKASDKGDDEDDLLVSGRASIGIARGRAMQSRPSMKHELEQTSYDAKTMAQRPVQQVAQQPGDEDNDVDDLANNNSSASGTATIGLACGKAIRSSSPSSVHINQDQPPSTHSTPGSQTSLSVNNMEQPLSSYSSGQPSHSISSVEQPMSPYSISGGQPSLQSSAEQPTAGRLSPLTRSIEQPLSARSTASGRQHLGVKAVPVIPHTVPMPLKPTSSVSSTEASTDNRRDKRLSSDFGSMSSLKDRERQQSTSALQDELDMLQDENESLIEKLQLAEERCEEAEARAQQLEKQIANLGEGVTLEARLLSRKEAALQEREAALRAATQTHGGIPEQIASLRTEAEIARDEATSALDKLHEAECEIKSLQTVTQRMMLTEEEMEEVVLKRCWLARYWSLCVEHGIQAEIAGAKHEYWSSFAPLPVEIVLAAGQRAKEEESSSNNDLEEREKVLQDFGALSGERNVESMLLVEKGLRELALFKVEDAVAFAMAKNRRQNLLKTDEVKLPTEGQFEAFELSQEESEDVRFKQSWLIYFWRRAMNHGVEPDIAEERLQSWINRSSRLSTSQDAVDVERGLMELRKLGLESQLWRTSRQGLELGSTTRLHIETNF